MKQDRLVRTIEIKDRSGRVVGTKEVVTYQGLLSKAHEEGLSRVTTTLVQVPSDENDRTAVATAEVQTSKGVFTAIGDASPENVNSFIVPHLIRMAETRAKARALRDAVNVGVVSFEELDGEHAFGEDSGSGPGDGSPPRKRKPAGRSAGNGGGKASAGNGAMSEAQRRYLFRLLAGQGLEGEAAHAWLREALGVESLKDAGKREASALIDRLLNEPAEEEAADAPA